MKNHTYNNMQASSLCFRAPGSCPGASSSAVCALGWYLLRPRWVPCWLICAWRAGGTRCGVCVVSSLAACAAPNWGVASLRRVLCGWPALVGWRFLCVCAFDGFLLWIRIASACPTIASLCNNNNRHAPKKGSCATNVDQQHGNTAHNKHQCRAMCACLMPQLNFP